MKQHIVLGFVLLLCISQTTFGQVVIPHAIPCVTITPENILTLPSGISANECITADGETVNFKPDQHYSIRAGEYIEFNENTVITPDGSHQFHAYIQKEELDVAWYYPNETPGTVGRYEKLEIGVQFDSTIQNKIERFVNREAGTKLNPFNPEDVDVYAEFWVKIEGYWFYHKRVNGFYYQEFSRNIDTLTWDTVATLHNFRVRYAPPQLGTFRCRITAEVFGHDTLVATDFTFDVVPSSNKGFMDVGENYKYFEFGEEPFFPVGHNLLGPEDDIKGAAYKPTTVPAYGYVNYHKALRHLKESGANYYRYLVSPWQTEIEYEHLGDYSNRMTNAWEFDNILDTTKALGLKMHFNMAIHFNWDQPNGDGKIYWDWSASGDSLNTPITPWGLDGCFRDIDSGYCYRKDLDMEDPRDFFSDVEAIKHYKNRIRYMEARWGYSTEIAITEILSEASHVGTTCELVYTEDYGCGAAFESDRRPYRADYTYFPAIIRAWHKTMSDFMKDSLKSNHLISVSYAGAPDFSNGDDSYKLDNVDIMTFNNYQIALDNIEKSAEYIKNFQTDYEFQEEIGKEINKPFMHSEYGYGSQFIYKCDNNASFIHRISTGSFTGLASLPLTWDSQFDEQGGWSYYQNINDLMQGIQLDNENWSAAEVMVQDDKSVEVFHLRKEDKGANSKAIGAISNRTFNYFTFGDLLDENGDTSKCKRLNGELTDENNEAYLKSKSYAFEDLNNNQLKIEDLGPYNNFWIEWYNALTGDFIVPTLLLSNLWGNAFLEFPDSLTGDAAAPILIFKLYPTDEPFLSPLSGNAFETSLPLEFSKDEIIPAVEITNWTINVDSISFDRSLNVIVSPNPTQGKINIQITGGMVNQCDWSISNENGAVILNGVENTSIFVIDLSDFTSGTYFLNIHSNVEKSTTKIIKL
jgi:hypothetical protein